MSMTIEYYWRPGCPFCMMLTPQIEGLEVPVTQYNIWDDPEAAARVRAVAEGNETVPTVIIGDQALVNPSIAQVRELIVAQNPDVALPKPAWWQRMLGAK